MKPKHILILEDDIDLALQWTKEFSLRELEATHSTTVQEALALCKEQVYDAIVCDMFLEGINNIKHQGGLTLLHKLKEAALNGALDPKYGRDVPIIGVSGCSNNIADTIRALASNFGCKTFLLKPILPAELVEEVILTIEYQ